MEHMSHTATVQSQFRVTRPDVDEFSSRNERKAIGNVLGQVPWVWQASHFGSGRSAPRLHFEFSLTSAYCCPLLHVLFGTPCLYSLFSSLCCHLQKLMFLHIYLPFLRPIIRFMVMMFRYAVNAHHHEGRVVSLMRQRSSSLFVIH